MYTSSQVESAINPITTATSAVTDLLSSASLTDLTKPQESSPATMDQTHLPSNKPLTIPFSAIIDIADATAHGLMKAQLDLGVPVVFGLLTVLNEEQGLARAGLVAGKHCHGEDWGKAAVELGVKNQAWSEGRFS